MMPKMKNKYMSMLLSALMCFSNSFTVIHAEEETVPEEPEVLETVEEQQEPEEMSGNEIISDQTLSEEQEIEETDSLTEELPVEFALDEETEAIDPETDTVEESEISETLEETQTELFADQEDTTWQNDFYYKLVGDHLQLNRLNASYSCYKGTAEDVTIPAHAVVDGVSYTTELGERAFNNDAKIVNLSFEDGVLLPGDCSFVLAACIKLQTLDISNLDTSHVTSMYCMFNGNRVMTTLDLGDPDTSNVTNMQGMFGGCALLPELDLSVLETENVTNMSSMFGGCSSLTTLDVSPLNTGKVTNMYSMFSGCKKLTVLDVSMLDTRNVTDMSNMFENCSSLTTLDVSTLNTSQVKKMSNMFSGCKALTTLDVSGFDTGNVTTMKDMFRDCNALPTLDVSGFKTGNVTSMYGMFSRCESLMMLDVSGFDTKNVTQMDSMFSYCSSLTALDVSNFDTGNVTRMSDMFEYCSSLVSLDISMFNTVKTKDLYGLFRECNALTTLKVNGIDTSNVTNMSYMFYNCSSLTSIDISGLDTGNVTNMSNMFYGCSKLAELDVSTLNTNKVTSMSGMFSMCSSLTALDVSSFDTENVTSMGSMFYNCRSLTALDISTLNTSNVVGMSSMFSGCRSLTELNVRNLDTSSVWSWSYMFADCSALTTLDLRDLDTGNATSMAFMFKGDSSLTTLDISMLDTGNVTDMHDMFSDCSSLTSLNLGEINTASVKDMSNMFSGCASLPSLDVSKLDTCSVTNMSNMFYQCKQMTKLDLGNFNMTSVKKVGYIFEYYAKDTADGGNLYLPASFPLINYTVFSGANINNIYYYGTEEQWNSLIGSYSISELKNADIHFNYVPGSEEDPDDQQTDWEYNDVTYTMIIQGTGNMSDYTDEEVPWKDIRDNILSAVIGNEFESIGSSALQNIAHLKRIYIPAAVTKIKINAFNNTPELKDVYFAGTQEQWEAITIEEGNSSLSTATVHYQCSYDFSTVWEFDTETSVLKISGNGPMMDLQDTSAPWYVFKDQITTIVIKEGITAIGAYTFKDITNLNRMYIPLSALTITEYALDNDQLLLDVYYTGTKEQWDEINIEAGNEVLSSDTLRFHFNSPYEETESEETLVQIKRNDVWYDAVKVKQTYYLGTDEEAELHIIPASKYDNVGFIALKRGTETLHACFPEDGTITFVPGKELAVGDTLKIVLSTLETETIEELELAIEIIENSFTVSYFMEKGELYKTAVYHLGSEIQKPEDPVREGSFFKGWYTNEACTGIDFFDVRNVYNKNKISTDISLYANWYPTTFRNEDIWSFSNSGAVFCTPYYNDLPDIANLIYKYEIKKEDYNKLVSLEKEHPVKKSSLKKEKDTPWGGSCFGMSAAALLEKLQYYSISSFDQSAENVSSASLIMNNSGDKDVGSIESMINYYHLLQTINPLKSKIDNFSEDNESENIKNIIQIMEQENAPVVLNIWIVKTASDRDGHSVVAYDFHKESDNEYTFSVYDCSLTPSVTEVAVYKDSSGTYTVDYGSWEVFWKRSENNTGNSFSHLFMKNAITARDIAAAAVLTEPGVITKKKAMTAVRSNDELVISLETGYSSFTVSNGNGTATISNSAVLSDGIGGVVSHGQNNSLYGPDRYVFDLPVLSEGDSYTIIPTDMNADNYKTVMSYENMKDGFFVLVDADKAGAITIDRYGKVTTNYDSDTLQKIWVCSEQMETPWYLVEFEGTSTGFTAEAVNGTVQSAAATDIQIAVESDFNRYEISNVAVGTDGVQIVEGDNLTCEVVSGDEIIGGGTFGYSVVFDSSLGSNVQSLLNVPAGTKIQKPEDPTRDGYVFEGWYKEKTFDTKWDFDTDEVTDDLVLYAGWSADEDYLVTVTFKIPEIKDAVVYLPRNTILDAEKYPTSQESTSLKWYTDPELTNEWSKTASFAEDTILYAGEAEAVITDYGEVLAEDIPADGIIPEGIWTAGIKDTQYAGSAINQNFRVYDGTKLLKEKTDYTITYKNNTNAYAFDGDRSSFVPAKGDKTPYILITGKGNYSGKTYVPFSIDQVDINDPDKVYIEKSITLKVNGKVQRPVPVITYNGKTVSSKEYTLYYYDEVGQELNKKTGPKAAGTYTIVLVPNHINFTGDREVQIPLTISDTTEKAKATALSKAITITAPPTGELIYDGTEKTNAVITSKTGYTLEEGKDYTVTYTKNVNAGTATVTATGKGIYTGTVKKTFKITPHLYAGHEGEFTFDVSNAVYSKGGAIPEVHVTWKETELVQGTDYTLKYANNKAVTKDSTTKLPTVTVTFKGNFKGTAKEEFEIEPKDLDEVLITAKDLTYKKGKYKSTPVLTDTDGKKLKAGTDYEKTYEYTGNIIDGDAEAGSEITVTVSAKEGGNYTGSKEYTYKILAAKHDIAKATFKIANQTYTGKAIELEEADILKAVINKTEELKLGEDYIIESYTKNVNKGTAKVTFKGIGEYGGTKTVSFKIGQRSITDYWQGVKNFFSDLF